VKPFAFPFTFARSPRTLVAQFARSLLRQRGEPPDRASPRLLGLPRGSPRRCGQDASYRPLQPTHDTSTRGSLDFRIRNLRYENRWILPRPRSVSSERRRTTFSLLSERVGNSAPVGHALDGAAPASAVSRTGISLGPLGPSSLEHHLVWWRYPDAAFSAAFRAGERPLTLPVAPRCRPEIRTSAENQNRFHRHLVNEGGLSRLRAPFLDKCSQEGRFRDFLRFAGTRHRSRGFATDDPASDALSPFQRSRVGGLDPSSDPRTLRPRSRWAARRLSTSAIDTIREHNHGSPKPRLTSPAVARWRSRSHDLDLSIGILSCGWRRFLRSAASRDFTGQGPRPR
jgi:hypothetical protein